MGVPPSNALIFAASLSSIFGLVDFRIIHPFDASTAVLIRREIRARKYARRDQITPEVRHGCLGFADRGSRTRVWSDRSESQIRDPSTYPSCDVPIGVQAKNLAGELHFEVDEFEPTIRGGNEWETSANRCGG